MWLFTGTTQKECKTRGGLRMRERRSYWFASRARCQNKTVSRYTMSEFESLGNLYDGDVAVKQRRSCPWGRRRARTRRDDMHAVIVGELTWWTGQDGHARRLLLSALGSEFDLESCLSRLGGGARTNSHYRGLENQSKNVGFLDNHAVRTWITDWDKAVSNL